MHMVRGAFCVIGIAVTAAACSRAPLADSSPAIRLDTTNSQQAIVEVGGLSPRDLSTLSNSNLTADEWSLILRVSVKVPAGESGAALPAVVGRYAVADSVRFIPMFPLDPGREYAVTFDPSSVPRVKLPHVPATQSVLSLPGIASSPSTFVYATYPTGEIIPENLLRMYVEFSGPMGQQGGLDHIAILDRAGQELTGAMLPLDTDLWNGDRTRYTVYFDPGRVKRDILPNRAMGRPLRRGDTVTLVIRHDWPDGRGLPLKSEFRRAYQVGPAIERPLDAAEWRVASPIAGTRDALRVTFPHALDHGLLQRALSMSRGGASVPGEWRIEPGETRCAFTPREPWQAGEHVLVALPILEDPSGNRIGRAFEVRSPGEAVEPESSQPKSIPFLIAAGSRR